jgi:hypothetical protein
MIFDPTTGDVVRIIRIRSLLQFDGDRDHLSGRFFVTEWDCPTPTTCPDPTSDLPTTPEFAPPGNTAGGQSRVRFP